MVTVPLYILVCVGGFPIYCDRLSSIRFWLDNGIQEGDGAILLVVVHCKLYGWVNTVNVFKEVSFVIFLLDDKCIIHIPEPHSRVGWQFFELFAQSTPYRGWPLWNLLGIP